MKATLFVLASRVGEDGTCWPSVSAIAVEAGISERGARLALRTLEAGGIIRTDHSIRWTGTYSLVIRASGAGETENVESAGAHPPEGEECAPSRHTLPRRGHCMPPGGEPCAPEESIEDTNKGEDSPPTSSRPHQVLMPLVLSGGGKPAREKRRADYGPEFEAWWWEYPRKVAKDAAAPAYTRAVARGATPAELLTGLCHTAWDPNQKFIPHPSRWLNEGRWKDADAEPRHAEDDGHWQARHAAEVNHRVSGVTTIDGTATVIKTGERLS